MVQLVVANRNVVILPPPEVEREAIRRSKHIHDTVGSRILLGGSTCRAHATLHQFALPEKGLAQLEEKVVKIAQTQKPFRVRLSQYSSFGGTGVFWDIDTEGNMSLLHLHATLVTAIDPLREGLIMEQHQDFVTGKVDIGKLRRLSLLKYGNPLAIESFHPHITIGFCLKQEDVLTITAELPTDPVSFDVRSVHITEVGPLGSCPGSLREFSFGAT